MFNKKRPRLGWSMVLLGMMGALYIVLADGSILPGNRLFYEAMKDSNSIDIREHLTLAGLLVLVFMLAVAACGIRIAAGPDDPPTEE